MATIDRKRVRELFEQAIELPPLDRGAFVEASAKNEPEILAEVRSLLGALQDAGEFQSSSPPTTDHSPTSADAPLTSTPPADIPMRQIGPYRLLERIGEGGFGDVFLAEQERPVRRRVALKLVKLGMDTRRVIARFEQERQALAMMEHPNIARVLDAGATPDGRPYFVMELVRGEAITTFCDRQKLSVRERLELFKSVCEAVQHAHQKGIIHRDIKPSNVLVALSDVGGGRPVAKVIDFGIAKATGEPLTDKTLFTEHRQLIGTPEYMSPEQAEMTAVDVDTRSDIYSLGVLLYELLTGTTPIEGKTLRAAAFGEMLRLIRETDPPRPSTRVRTLARTSASSTLSRKPARREDQSSARNTDPAALGSVLKGELDWIAMKAIEKDRTRRYDTASGLAADIQRFLDGRSVEAGPPGALYRVQTMVRRNRVAFAAAAAVTLALLVGLALAVAGFLSASRDRDAARASEANESAAKLAAQQQQANAEASRDDARRAESLAESRKAQVERHLYRSALAAASAAIKDCNAGPGLIGLRSIPPENRGWEWRVLERLADRATATLRLDPGERVESVWPMRDPMRAVAWLDEPQPGLAIWSITTGEVIRRFNGEYAAIAPDDRLVATVIGSEIVVRSAESGEELWRSGKPAGGTWRLGPASFSLDSTQLVGTDGSGELIVFAARTGERLRTTRPNPPPEGILGFLDFGASAPPSRTVYFSSSDAWIAEADGRSSRDIEFFFTLLPSRTHTGFEGGVASVVRGGSYLAPRTRLNGNCVSSDLSPNGRHVVSADTLGGIAITDIVPGASGNPESRACFPGAESSISQVNFSSSGDRILLTTRSGRARSLPIDAGAAAFRHSIGTSATNFLSPDRTRVARLGWGEISMFETNAGLPLWSRSFSSRSLLAAAWSPAGDRIAVASDLAGSGELAVSELYIIDAATGNQIVGLGRSAVSADPVRGRETPAWTGSVQSMCFSADGSRLYISRRDGSVAVADTGAWQVLEQPSAAPTGPQVAKNLSRCRLSRDGRTLIQIAPMPDAGKPHLTVLLRDAATLQTIRSLPAGRLSASVVAFASDGTDLFVGYEDGTIIRWDTATGTIVWRNEPIADRATAIAVSPDGSRIVAFFEIAEGLVFDARTGEQLAGLPVPEPACDDAAFTSDGTAIVLGTLRFPVARLDSEPLDAPVPSSLLSLWPAAAGTPRTLLEARSLVMQAGQLIPERTRLYRGKESAERETASNDAVPDRVKAVARAILDRIGLPLRTCNNNALVLLLKAQPTREEHQQAETLLAELVGPYPNDPPIHLNLGTARFRLGKLAECIPPLERGLALLDERQRPPYVLALYMLAVAQKELGNKAESAKWRALAEKEAAAQNEAGDAQIKELAERLTRGVE